MTTATVRPVLSAEMPAVALKKRYDNDGKSFDRSGDILTSGLFCDHYRFFILFLGLLCLTSIFSNMITLNFTLICMDQLEIVAKNISNILPLLNITKRESDSAKATTSLGYPIHHYTQYEKTLLQWTISISSLVATFPFSWICTKYGARWTFFASGVASALSTAAIPPAAEISFTVFLFVRVIQGLAYACDFAIIGILCTRWASLHENAKFLGILTCFSPLAAFLTNSFAGAICESSWGWPWVHYSHALVSLALFAAWGIFYTDDPRHNVYITSCELATIHRNKSDAHKIREPFVPYLEITKDKVIWAVWANSFADLFSGSFLLIYAPTYINNVLGYNTTETGVLGALVAVAHIPVKVICGIASDTLHCCSERIKLCIFNTVALLSPAAIYVYLCFASASVPMITIVMFGLVHAGLGFNCGGFYKCGALVSRQYAEFVIACSQLIKCAVFFVAPALVAIFVQDDRNEQQWHVIFYIIAGMLVAANVMFCIYATDEPRPFTKITAQNYRRSKAQTEVIRLKDGP